jgi:valyl-tRNA synthetase
MDSSISGLQIIGFKRDDGLFKRGFGNVIRPQGKDIVRTWLFYSLLRTYQLTKKPAFKEVWVSGHVVDEKGEKMSKSKGNSPPPKPIIDKYGADAMRLFGVLEAGLGSDVRFSEDRLAGVSKFMTKLWNISRFVSMFPIPSRLGFSDLTPVDQWILAETNKMIEGIISDCELLDFHKPATDVKAFAWSFLADHVVEMLKARCLNTDGIFTVEEQQSGWYALHEALKVVLKALAPITPFITDRVYRELYSKKGIHRERFPSSNTEWQCPLTKDTNLVLQTDTAIWKFKRDSNLSLRQGIAEACLPGKLKPWGKDLKAMHGIQAIWFTKPKRPGFIEVPIPESDEVIYVKAS